MPPPRKPKVARKGDSQLEQLIVDVTSGNASPVQYGIFSAIVVSVLAIAGGVYYVMASKVVALSPEDTAALKDVFYSGEPWLIECTKERKASPVFYAAEGALSGFKFGAQLLQLLLQHHNCKLSRIRRQRSRSAASPSASVSGIAASRPWTWRKRSSAKSQPADL